jgi:hypothetical protein
MGLFDTINDFFINLGGEPSTHQIAVINAENDAIQIKALKQQGYTDAEIADYTNKSHDLIARHLKNIDATPVSNLGDALLVDLKRLTGNFFGFGPGGSSGSDPNNPSPLDKLGTLIKWVVVGGAVVGTLYFAGQFFKVVKRK